MTTTDRASSRAQTSMGSVSRVDADPIAILRGRVARTAALVLLPLVAVGALYIYRGHLLWAILLAALELVLAFGGGLLPLTPRVRARVFPIGLVLVGTVDLLLRGWSGDGHLAYLAFVGAAAILVGRRAGFIALGLTTVLLLGYGLLATSNRLVPFYPLTPPTRGEVATTWAIFVIAASSISALAGYLIPRLAEALEVSQQATQSEVADREALFEQFADLREAHRTAQRRASHLVASLSVARQLASVFDLGTLLNSAAASVVEEFGFDEAQVFLMDSFGEWASLVATSSAEGEGTPSPGHRLRKGSDSLVGWVVEHRRSRMVDLSADEAAVAFGQSRREACTAVALPLDANGQLLGVLVILSAPSSGLSEDDLGTLEGFAGYLAQVVDNARGFRDEAAALEAGSPFLGTANLLATARTESHVYDAILDVLRDAGPSRVLIVRVLAGGAALRVVVDYQGEQANRAERELTDLSPASLVDLVLIGLSLDAPLWAENLTNLDPALSPELVAALGGLAESTRSTGLAVIPIRTEARQIEGEVVVLYRTAHRFASVERRLHQLLVDFGGAALERTRLLADAQSRLGREHQLSVIGERIRHSTDVDTILRVSARELARTLRAADGEIRLNPRRQNGSGVGSETGTDEDLPEARYAG